MEADETLDGDVENFELRIAFPEPPSRFFQSVNDVRARHCPDPATPLRRPRPLRRSGGRRGPRV